MKALFLVLALLGGIAVVAAPAAQACSYTYHGT